MTLKLSLSCLLLAATSPLWANSQHQPIEQAVSRFVAQQTASLPGKVSFKVEPLDSRLSLSPCPEPEVYLPSGSQLIGRSSVGVRCRSPQSWQTLVTVNIRLQLTVLSSARPLSRDHVISADDLRPQTIEITRMLGFTEPQQLIGKVLRYSITEGQILREDMLREPFKVEQGQTVSLILQGQGFQIRSEGVALNNASIGQSVRVRSSQGKVISGTAQANGNVQVRF